MKQHHQDKLRTWLRAERRGLHDEAETALFGVFEVLPLARPSKGFAKRVLLASGIATQRLPWSWKSRFSVAASLLLVSSSMAFFLPALFEVLGLMAPAEVVTVLVEGVLTVGHRLHDVLPLWQLAQTLYRTLMQVVGSPPVLLMLTVMILLSGAALRGLMSLLPTPRSLGYA